MCNHTAIITPSKINKNLNAWFIFKFPQKLQKCVFVVGFFDQHLKQDHALQ